MKLFALAMALAIVFPIEPSASDGGFSYPEELKPVIEFLDRETWIHPLIGEPFGPWLRKYTLKIVLDPTIPPAYRAVADHATHVIYWRPDMPNEVNIPIAAKAAIIVHEGRHLQGYRHSCAGKDGYDTSDETMEEGGAVAVHVIFLEHFGLRNWVEYFKQYVGCGR